MNPKVDLKSPIKILVADDHPVVLDGVVAMVNSASDMDVVATATGGAEALKAYMLNSVDVVLLDLNMPGMDGLSVITAIRSKSPDVRIIAFTSFSGDVRASRVIKAGAKGFLLKTSARSELLDAIRAVHRGETYLSSTVALEIAMNTGRKELTPREVEVLKQIATCGPTKLVATEMGISEGTIKIHIKSVLAKLDVIDRTQAIYASLKRGIISNW